VCFQKRDMCEGPRGTLRAHGSKIQLKKTKSANRGPTNVEGGTIQLYSFLEAVTAAYVGSIYIFKSF
jgi:hypothetical protein